MCGIAGVLCFEADARERVRPIAASMLRALGVESVRLMTNNPSKISGLREHGIEVVGRIPVIAGKNEHNVRYLSAKQRAGHWLERSGT